MGRAAVSGDSTEAIGLATAAHPRLLGPPSGFLGRPTDRAKSRVTKSDFWAATTVTPPDAIQTC